MESSHPRRYPRCFRMNIHRLALIVCTLLSCNVFAAVQNTEQCFNEHCSVLRGGQQWRASRPVVAKASACVVRIVSQQGDTTRHGSGILIDQRHVLTCWHILYPGCRPTVIFTDGVRAKTEILATDAEHDVALLRLSLSVSRSTARLSTFPQPGQRAWADGYYHGTQYKTISGNVLGYKDNMLFMTGQSIASMEGMSGGPIYDRDGVVALLTQTRTTGNGRWEAGGPHIGWLKQFIAEHTQSHTPEQTALEPIVRPETGNTELKAQLDRLEAMILKYQKTPGPQGERGPVGPPGTSEVPPAIDYDRLAAEVLLRLPPVKLEIRHPNGKTFSQAKPLGEAIVLELVPK